MVWMKSLRNANHSCTQIHETTRRRGRRRLVGIAMAVAWLAIVSHGSAMAQVTQYAVVPNSNGGSVTLLDTEAGITSPAITLTSHPNCTATTKDGRFAYATTRDGGGLSSRSTWRHWPPPGFLLASTRSVLR